MNEKLTFSLLFPFSFCRTNFWFRHFLYVYLLFFPFINSIIKLNQWIFEYTNQAPRNHSARVTSGCLWIWLSFSYPPACFPRLSVFLFFFFQAFFPKSQEDTYLLYHCKTNLWVRCIKQNFEIHLSLQRFPLSIHVSNIK